MKTETYDSDARRRHFIEKRDQLTELVDRPVVLFWGKWPGYDVVALTLADDFTRPTFVIVHPDGRTVAFAQKIEASAFYDLDGLVKTRTYEDKGDLKSAVLNELQPGTPILAEISNDYWGFDTLPPAYLVWLNENYEVASGGEVFLQWRACKKPGELALMKRAALATLEVFDEVTDMVKPGIPELDILEHLQHAAIDRGDDVAFHPIVAAGPRSTDPHPERRTDNRLKTGDRLIVDYGIRINGYNSDITRTFIVGGNPEDDPYYEVTLAVIDFVRSADLSEYTLRGFGEAITEVIAGYGFVGSLKHGHGHGLGVETHDPHPYVTDKEFPHCDDPFAEGMVFTMEPGFYDENGGFRIEDDYAVQGNRAVPVQELEL
ncbi:MAG: aminopeptidase P family protein [Candidatus Coatesbacteria bacterium]|nr:MAG: aminopeptidase P family protein [Candidatus Coatesbacteria bacterium]